jgi:predicted nucleic acid-binding Zn ribbon protein
MPFTHSPQALTDLLSSVIKNMGIQRKLDEVRTVETWAALAGPQINGITHSVWVRGDKLYVKITSAAWRHELHLRRREWLDQLNEQLGAELVREIIFR